VPISSPEAYLRPEVIRQVERFDLKAKFLREGFLAGLHSSPFRGFSVEFSEHRRYVPGDDTRSVDWKVWSRTNRYYVKQYQAETNMVCHLLVDLSASMGYRGPHSVLSKLEYATYLAGALAYMMVRQQDPVGLITFGASLQRYLKPRSRSAHLLTILRVLHESRPAGSTGLAATLHAVAELIPHRGLVVLLSDLLDDEKKLVEALSHLRYRGHDVIVFQILDASEARFDFEGLTKFVDIEDEGVVVVAEPRSVRAAYLDELARFRARCDAECSRRRMDFAALDTGTSFDKGLLAYLRRRHGK
jgi:uncharacterized protein (DUF58 family)